MLIVMRKHATRIVLSLLVLLGTTGPIPYTAPQGDLDADGVVGVADLQCMTLLFDYSTVWADLEQGACSSDEQCQQEVSAQSYCRAEPSLAATCVPNCLAANVILASAAEQGCDKNVPESELCIRGVWKRAADLDCDGAITSVDFGFLVAIILLKVGGAGTSDLDNDGQLNFCDNDSDDDGLEDPLDCAPLDPASPDCQGKECGDDGCGQSCGQCPAGLDCIDYYCTVAPTLLVTDETADQIFKLDASGNVLAVFASPVSLVRGVAHDKRTPETFWVMGSGNIDTFYQLDLATGELISTVFDVLWQGIGDNDIRGLGFYLGSGPEYDQFLKANANVNSIDGVHGNLVGTGEGVFKTSYFFNGFQSGYWGVDHAGSTSDHRWATNYDSDALEQWIGSTFIGSISIPLDEPRGVSLDGAGGFWVVDQATASVVHLDSDGEIVTTFGTPGSKPLGISYHSPSL